MNSRISFICKRSAELRKGKTVEELSQRDAMLIANTEFKDGLV